MTFQITGKTLPTASGSYTNDPAKKLFSKKRDKEKKRMINSRKKLIMGIRRYNTYPGEITHTHQAKP